MKKKIEVNGITYELKGDKYYPVLSLPTQNDYKIGKYGLLHLDYLKVSQKGRYTSLLAQGEFNSYLHKIDEQAIEMMEDLITQLAKTRDINEELKASDPVKWVAEMNNIKASAEEVVLREAIYQ